MSSRLRLALLVFEDRESQLGGWDEWPLGAERLSSVWTEEMADVFDRAVDEVVVESVIVVDGDTPTSMTHRAHMAVHRRIRNLEPFASSEPGDFWVVWVVGLPSYLGMALPLYRNRRPLRPGGIVIIGAGNLIRPMRDRISDRLLRYAAWLGMHELGHLMPQGLRDNGALRYGLGHSSSNPFLAECIARHVMCYSPSQFAARGYVDGDGWDEDEIAAWQRAPWLKEVPTMAQREHFQGPLPVEADISSPYGAHDRDDRPLTGHTGIDLAVVSGTPVKAPVWSLVQRVHSWGDRGHDDFAALFGNCVILQHILDGRLSLYAHLSELKVYAGDVLSPGHVVGLSGATGRASGPHLHVGYAAASNPYFRSAGTLYDPLPWLHRTNALRDEAKMAELQEFFSSLVA